MEVVFLGLLDYAVVRFCAESWFFCDEVGVSGVVEFHGFDYGFSACTRVAYPPPPGGWYRPNARLSLLDEVLVAPWPSTFFVSPQLAVFDVPSDCFSDAFFKGCFGFPS